MGVEFENWLEQELKRGFTHTAGHAPSTPRYASLAPLAGGHSVIYIASAAAKSKLAVVGAAAALAAGGGVGAKAAITGDANPFNWGQQVKHQVQTCKQQLAAGQHGIGKCVSAFAKQHGAQRRQAHSHAASHTPEHAPGTGKQFGLSHRPTNHPERRSFHSAGPPNPVLPTGSGDGPGSSS
jgi:hypothetical protein